MGEVVVHQFDPFEPAIGGTDGFITDLIRSAPKEVDFRILGVANPRSGLSLGVWEEVRIGTRRVPFMALAHVDLRGSRPLPRSAQLVFGLCRFRPRLEGARIHAHRCDVGLPASLLYPRTPLVQFVHENGAEALGNRHETFWRFLPIGYRVVERLAVSRAQHVIVMNYEASRRLRRLSARVVYGRNWFDGTIYRPDRGEDASPKGCVGWIGRLEEAKDPALAIATFRELKKLGQTFRAWVAGSGSLFDAIRGQVAREGLAGEVELLGELTAQELAARLRRTSVLLITSHSEGLPRAALEALGSGTPVVSTRCGDLVHVISDRNGSLVASRQPRQLAETICRVESSVSRSETARSVEKYEMRVVLDDLFRTLGSVPPFSTSDERAQAG
jgi:glycosyltransferase involved in cell wall biosynthesis